VSRPRAVPESSYVSAGTVWGVQVTRHRRSGAGPQDHSNRHTRRRRVMPVWSWPWIWGSGRPKATSARCLLLSRPGPQIAATGFGTACCVH
jgi:hypothetical protein